MWRLMMMLFLPGAGGADKRSWKACMRGRLLNQMKGRHQQYGQQILPSCLMLSGAIPVIITLDGGVFYPQLMGNGPAGVHGHGFVSAVFGALNCFYDA